DHETIDDREQRVHDMLDPDDRYALLPYRLDQIDERDAFMLGQPTRNLVEEEHAGRGRKRARELEALAVDQRERAGIAVGLVGEPALLKQRGTTVIGVAL